MTFTCPARLKLWLRGKKKKVALGSFWKVLYQKGGCQGWENKASVNEKPHLKRHISSQTTETKSILRMLPEDRSAGGRRGAGRPPLREARKANKQTSHRRAGGLDSVRLSVSPTGCPLEIKAGNSDSSPKKNILAQPLLEKWLCLSFFLSFGIKDRKCCLRGRRIRLS